MARHVTETALCDICGGQDDIETFTIATEADGTVVVDLCVTHKKPVKRVIKAGSQGPQRSTRKASKRPGVHRVEPVD